MWVRHNPYPLWLEENKAAVLSAMCAILRDALKRLPAVEPGKTRFPVWERWANAVLDSLGLLHIKVGILTENLETPGLVKDDLLNALVKRAADLQKIEHFKRDDLVHAFNDAGHDPARLPGVRGIGDQIFGKPEIEWDHSPQKFGSWVAKIVSARSSVKYLDDQWCLLADTDRGSNRQYWVERA